jgi:hypothetical protein
MKRSLGHNAAAEIHLALQNLLGSQVVFANLTLVLTDSKLAYIIRSLLIPASLAGSICATYYSPVPPNPVHMCPKMVPPGKVCMHPQQICAPHLQDT